MSILDTIKLPEPITVATHKAIDKVIFIKSQQNTKPPQSDTVVSEELLEKDEQVIILEDGIGYGAKWTRIKKKVGNDFDTFGFTLSKFLVPLEETKPLLSFSTDPKFQGDINAIPIDWKDLPINKVTDDKLNGNYIIHYDTGIQDFSNKQTLINDIKTSMFSGLITGSSLILDEMGKKGTIEEATRLQNGYFIFGKAESIYFPIRPCSTMRVLVTVPKRYVEQLEDGEPKKFPLVNIPVIDPNAIPPQKPEEQRYSSINFKNYEEFKVFMKNIVSVLEDADTIFGSTTWSINPSDVQLSIKNEISLTKDFFEKINNFIFLNFTKEQEKQLKFTDGIIIQEERWRGSLEFIFDKQELKIASIQFKTPTGQQIGFRKGVNSLLKDNTVSNKTIINYILQSDSKKENFGKSLKLASQIGGTLNAIKNFDPSKDRVGQPLNDFLVESHYPVIKEMIGAPPDLANCLSEEANLINSIYNNKNRQIKRQVGQAIDSVSIEKQAAQSGAGLQGITNKNVRIILGLDKQDPSGNPYGGLNKVLAAISLLDIDRFIAEYYSHASKNIDLTEYNKIVEQYSKAKNLLDSVVSTTVCNPYVTKVLKKIQMFQLPRLPTYNPQKNLADSLTRLIIKIINDVVVLTIKTRLEKAIKDAISSAKDKFLNDGSKESDELKDSLNSLLDDVSTDENILNDILTEEQKNLKAKQDSGNTNNEEEAPYDIRKFIEDVTCVLSLQELCRLFNGKIVEDDVIDLIKSLIKNKHQPLSSKLSTNQDITTFFFKLGRLLDPGFCTAVEELNPQIPINPLCDDGTIKAARESLLSDKGLTPDVVNGLLEDIKAKEQKNFEDLNKFLNGDPFDFTNIPSILCKTGENGEKIPPTVDFSQPLDFFNSNLKSLMENAYNTFDSEQQNWYNTTYTVASTNNNRVTLDKDGNITSSNTTANEEDNRQILVGNVFKNYLNPTIDNVDKNLVVTSTIDGSSEQKNDVAFITDDFRNKIYDIENRFKNFIAELRAFIIKNGFIITLTDIAYPSSQRTEFRKAIDKMKPFLVYMENLSKVFNNDKSLEDNPSSLQIKMLFDGDNEKISFIIALNRFIEINGLKPDDEFQLDQDVSAGIRAFGEDSGERLVKEIEQIIKDYQENIKIFKLLLKTTVSYPIYKFNSNLSTNNISSSYYYETGVNIEKNNFNFINYTSSTEVSSEIVDYIKNELKITDLTEKGKIFSAYIKKFNPELESVGEDIYGSLSNVYYNGIFQNIKQKSRFLEIKKENAKVDKDKEKTSEIPYTKYLKLKVEQTPDQKQCGIRPHYLDLDSIRDSASKSKENTFCLETVLNEKIANNEAVDTNELDKVQTTDTENIMIGSFHNAYIRALLHDIILRSISLWGYYDPQEIRKEQEIIDFLYEMFRYETKVLDQTYYNMFTSFYVKSYKEQNKDSKFSDEIIKEKVIKDIIKKELKEIVLPKLAKRILEDTNKDLISLKDSNILISLKRFENDYNEILKKEYNSNFYSTSKINIFIPSLIPEIGYGSSQEYFIYNKEKPDEFVNSIEYRVLFEYLFPLKKYLANIAIQDILCTMTRKINTIVFNGTKKEFIRVAKSIQSKGQGLNADLNNPQDMANTGEVDMGWYIFQAALKSGLNITKGFIETVDPNISISSKVFAAAKTFEPKINSIVIPSTSYILAIAGLPPNPLLALPYYGLGLWNEESDDKNDKKSFYLESLLQDAFDDQNSKKDCSMVKNEDVVALDPTTGLYNKK